MNYRCVIVDIDGTLANNKYRVHHVERKPKNWDLFNAEMHKDEAYGQMVELIQILRQHYAIVLCSGRQECHRQITEAWLSDWNIAYEALYMRTTEDFRSDAEVKSELLDEIIKAGFVPMMVIDDRNSVVKMWRERGLLCLQCAEGDF